MKTIPWFSTERKNFAYEHKETVHHDNMSCQEGGNILKKHLQSGTDNRPLCKQCARLNAAILDSVAP
jgi:hypothetical protein